MHKLAGMGIAVVAPGGYAPDEGAYARAESLFRSHGCSVRFYCDPMRRHQRFGGIDEDRAAQLHAAASAPDMQVVLALRGGYGMSRLLPLLDFKILARSGKLFVGHSDFTAFQLGLLAKAGGCSFAGPMVCDDFSRPDLSGFTLDRFAACITSRQLALEFGAEDNPVAEVSGQLWGGNLTMLTHLLGTPYFPDISGGILFVEDVNEHPYRVERMLLQLAHAGVLGRQHALVLGDFSKYKLSEYDNGYDFETMLAHIRKQAGIPILAGLPFGHIVDKLTLPVGASAVLVSNCGRVSLSLKY